MAGIVEDVRLSLPLHRVVVAVRVEDGRDVSWYEITFTGVTRFVFADNVPEAWIVPELTSAGMWRADGETHFGLELTSIDDAVTITCRDSQVTLVEKGDNPLA